MPLQLNKISNKYHHMLTNDKLHEKKYILLYKVLWKMLNQDEIPENSLLPPSRELAAKLGLSRSTILRVYDLLTLDDLIIATQGSGYLVKAKEKSPVEAEEKPKGDYPAYSKIGKSFISLGQSENINTVPDVAFSPGLPPLDIFPVNNWKKLSNAYWKEIKFSNLAYSPSTGMERLKQNICNYLKLTRNIKCEPEQLILVSGSLQSIHILGSLFINPGNKVILEDPCFPNVQAIFRGLMAQIIAAPVDKEGINLLQIDQDMQKAKLMHVTPGCQYPSGIQMSISRRQEVLEYARSNKLYVIENDYEHELHYANVEVPTLYALDKDQRTIHLGTFNRILHPSLRIGYMVVPHHLVKPVETILKHTHRFVAPSIQFVLNQFIEKKYLHNHVHALINTVKEREKYFLQNFQILFSDVNLQIEECNTLSLQRIIRIGSNQNEKQILEAMAKIHLSAHALSECFLSPQKMQGLIMGHSSVPKPALRNKLVKMKEALAFP